MVLWEEISEALSQIEIKLNAIDLSDDEKNLNTKKRDFLIEIYKTIEHIASSTDKSKLKFVAWVNKGKNQVEMSEKLGMTKDGLRATISYFNRRLTVFVGHNTIKLILECEILDELEAHREDFWKRVNSIKKDFFR